MPKKKFYNNIRGRPYFSVFLFLIEKKTPISSNFLLTYAFNGYRCELGMQLFKLRVHWNYLDTHFNPNLYIDKLFFQCRLFTNITNIKRSDPEWIKKGLKRNCELISYNFHLETIKIYFWWNAYRYIYNEVYGNENASNKFTIYLYFVFIFANTPFILYLPHKNLSLLLYIRHK